LISAYTGVKCAQALGAHRSASGSGSSSTIADPGAITVNPGALAYGVTMSNGVVGFDNTPAGFTHIATMSDASIKGDGEYMVSTSGGSVDPRWTWHFTTSSTWLASVLALSGP
jgi:hypothetical protein